jgi:hypothetical protein
MLEGVLMVLNQEEPQKPIQFYDNPAGYLVCNQCDGYYELNDNETPEDFEACACGNSLEYFESLFESDNPDLQFSESISKKVSIMSRLTSQAPFAEDILNNIRQDSWALWDSLDQFRSNEEHANQKLVMDDVIEMNRLMMIVDQKRAFEESKPSKVESMSQRVGLIGFLSAAIILLIIVLTLTILGKMI